MNFWFEVGNASVKAELRLGAQIPWKCRFAERINKVSRCVALSHHFPLSLTHWRFPQNVTGCWLGNLRFRFLFGKCSAFSGVSAFSGMIKKKTPETKKEETFPKKSGNFSEKKRNLLSFQVCYTYVCPRNLRAFVFSSTIENRWKDHVHKR